MRWARVTLLSLLWAARCMGQAQPSPSDSLARGLQEYQAGQFGPAAQDFAAATKAAPSDVYAHFYLGQSLFQQKRYADATGPFERAIDLDKSAKKLSPDQRRIVTDQLAMAYGISGDLKKTHALLDAAIRRDPQYPLNYYNSACAFAAEGREDQALANLSLAFQHKEHMPKGESLPDPRRDDSFTDYLRQPAFIKLMRANGLNEDTDPEDE